MKPKRLIGFDRVEPGVLQRVGLELRHQADAAPFLMFIDHQAASFLGDGSHGDLQLVAAVAAKRPEHFAGEALRMDAQQRSAACNIAHKHCERGFDGPGPAGRVTLERQGLKQFPTW